MLELLGIVQVHFRTNWTLGSSPLPSINIRALYEAPSRIDERLPYHFTERSGLLLFVKMLWPRDTTRQMQAFRRMSLPYQTLFEKSLAIVDDPLLLQATEFNWTILGGWEGISELPSKIEIKGEIARHTTKGRNAGAALFFLHCLHTHHAPQLQKILSLNNVWAWMERHGELLLGHPVKKDLLDDDWEHYRDVAHLWAAEFLLGTLGSTVPPSHDLRTAFTGSASGDMNPDLLGLIQEMDTLNHSTRHLLTCAAHFQLFGLTYTTKHARKPLLDGTSLLRVEEVPEWGIELPRVPLPDDLIASFNASSEPSCRPRIAAGQP